MYGSPNGNHGGLYKGVVFGLTLVGVILLGGLVYCGGGIVSYFTIQKEVEEDNRKVHVFTTALEESVKGKDMAAVLEYLRSRGIRSQVNDDGSIDCFPGKDATKTTTSYVESIHLNRDFGGTYSTFSYTYGPAVER